MICVMICLALALSACRGPDFVQDPLDYLGVGVDPDEEAEKIALQLGRAGYIVDRRIEGADAIALEARRLRDGATAVRIITSRGFALAIDAPDRRHRSRRSVSLGERPAFERRHSDGLYLLPIYVQTDDRLCIATILLDGAGFVRELTREEDPHLNDGCYPERVSEEDSEEDLEEGEGEAEEDALPSPEFDEERDEEPLIGEDDLIIEPDPD